MLKTSQLEYNREINEGNSTNNFPKTDPILNKPTSHSIYLSSANPAPANRPVHQQAQFAKIKVCWSPSPFPGSSVRVQIFSHLKQLLVPADAPSSGFQICQEELHHMGFLRWEQELFITVQGEKQFASLAASAKPGHTCRSLGFTLV